MNSHLNWFRSYDLFIVFVALVALCILLYQYNKGRVARIKAKQDVLWQKWQYARDIRLHWEDRQSSRWYNFFDMEYQDLWEKEISTEELWLMETKKKIAPASWAEYQTAKEKSGKQN